jgi:hypothetical protein
LLVRPLVLQVARYILSTGILLFLPTLRNLVPLKKFDVSFFSFKIRVITERSSHKRASYESYRFTKRSIISQANEISDSVSRSDGLGLAHSLWLGARSPGQTREEVLLIKKKLTVGIKEERDDQKGRGGACGD